MSENVTTFTCYLGQTPLARSSGRFLQALVWTIWRDVPKAERPTIQALDIRRKTLAVMTSEPLTDEQKRRIQDAVDRVNAEVGEDEPSPLDRVRAALVDMTDYLPEGARVIFEQDGQPVFRAGRGCFESAQPVNITIQPVFNLAEQDPPAVIAGFTAQLPRRVGTEGAAK